MEGGVEHSPEKRRDARAHEVALGDESAPRCDDARDGAVGKKGVGLAQLAQRLEPLGGWIDARIERAAEKLMATVSRRGADGGRLSPPSMFGRSHRIWKWSRGPGKYTIRRGITHTTTTLQKGLVRENQFPAR